MHMDDVELVGAPPDFVQHRQMRGDRGLKAGVEPERLVATATSRAEVMTSPLANSVT